MLCPSPTWNALTPRSAHTVVPLHAEVLVTLSLWGQVSPLRVFSLTQNRPKVFAPDPYILFILPYSNYLVTKTRSPVFLAALETLRNRDFVLSKRSRAQCPVQGRCETDVGKCSNQWLAPVLAYRSPNAGSKASNTHFLLQMAFESSHFCKSVLEKTTGLPFGRMRMQNYSGGWRVSASGGPAGARGRPQGWGPAVPLFTTKLVRGGSCTHPSMPPRPRCSP